MTLFFGHVNLFAARAEHFDPGGADVFAHSDGEDMLSFAEDSGADTENSFEVLFFHECESFRSEYEPGVDESVDVCGLLVDCEVSR